MDAARRRLTPLIAAAAFGLAASGCGGDDGGDQANPGPPEPSRIASARMYQGGQWVAPGETAQSIGAALAKLKPSYVSALLRYRNGDEVTQQQIDDWNTVVGAVRKASPDAKFAVELNGLEYRSEDDLEEMMGRVRVAVHPDGWLFDFYTPAAQKRPNIMQHAVQLAHENGEFLGGNAFGIGKQPPIPEDTDYLAVQDTGDFEIDLDDVRRLAQRVPVFFHLGNSPNNAGSVGCLFINQLTTGKRVEYVTMRARQQKRYQFRFAYPAFFPECERNRGGSNAQIYTYGAPNDPPMVDHIIELMDRYR